MYKRIYYFVLGLLPAFAGMLATSCSDELDSELFTKYTYLIDNGWQEDIEMEINEDNTVTLPIYYGVNGTSGNDKNITLKIAVDPDTLNDYNFDKNKNNTEAYYSILPEDCYTFDQDSYEIPSGELNATAICTIDLTTLRNAHDIYDEYVLPVKISESSGEIVGPSKYTKALYFLNLTNEYSGVYASNGSIRQLGSNYSTQATGKRLYAISNDECYIYAGNLDRTSTDHKKFIINLHFNSDSTITMTATNPDIEFTPLSANFNYKFTEHSTDSRKLNRRTAIYLKYTYKDISNIYQDVSYIYETTLTKNDAVFKEDFPNAYISKEE